MDTVAAASAFTLIGIDYRSTENRQDLAPELLQTGCLYTT